MSVLPFLPASLCQDAKRAKSRLLSYGLESEKIINFDDVFYSWSTFCTSQTGEHYVDDEYFFHFKDELVEALRAGEFPAWSDGYFSLDAFDDPMSDAYNLEGGPMGGLFIKMSDMLYVFEEKTVAPNNRALMQKLFGSLQAMLAVTVDETRQLSEGLLSMVVSPKAHRAQADIHVLRPEFRSKPQPI